MSGSKLIVKNTLFLYCRQIFVLFVALFTTRVVINTLGIDDYGLYNLIAGVVTMLTVLTSSMTLASQRFLSMSLGKGDSEEFKRIYDVCNTIYLILCLLALIIGEIIGCWFINTQLSIPSERIVAANWCYQFAVFSFLLGIMRIPSSAVIIAYEKMDFYAYISIIEVIFQLGIAFSLYFIPYDHLIVYSFLITVSSLIINLLYLFYCRINLHIRARSLSIEKQYLSPILSFSFWTLFGSIATIGSRQGVNILINMFFGVRLNAASAVATKVSSNAYSFVANFTTAYRPQIMKLYAAKSFNELYLLLNRTTKLSCFLFIIILIPIDINIDCLLHLWIGEVPEYSAVFCRLLLLYLLIDAMQSPLMAMVHAIGNIKTFQLVLSSILILNIPIMWFILNSHQPVEYIYVCYIVLNIVSSIYRIWYVKNRSTLKIKEYLLVSCRIILTFIASYSLCYVLVNIINIGNGWASLLISSFLCLVLSSCVIYLMGFNRDERGLICDLFKRRMNRYLTHSER